MTTTSGHADTTTSDIVITSSSNKPEEVLKYNVKFNGILELIRNKNKAENPMVRKIKPIIPNYFAGTKSSESSESAKSSESSESVSSESESSESSQSSSSEFYVFPGTKSSKSRKVDSNWKNLVNEYETKAEDSMAKTSKKPPKKEEIHWERLVDKYV